MDRKSLPAVVLVTRISTYAADADSCIASWIAASRGSLERLAVDGDDLAHWCELVRGQVTRVMPLMFHDVCEPTLAEAELNVNDTNIRFIVQVLPENDPDIV